MDPAGRISHSGRDMVLPANSPMASAIDVSASRRVNFSQTLGQQQNKPPSRASSQIPKQSFQEQPSFSRLSYSTMPQTDTSPSPPPRVSPRVPLSPRVGVSRLTGFDYQPETDRSSSYSRLQPGNTFQSFAGNESDSWSHASRSLSSAVHRSFALEPKQTGISDYSRNTRQSSFAGGSKRAGSGEQHSSPSAFASAPLRTRQQSGDSRGVREAESGAASRLQELQEWQEPEEEEHQQQEEADMAGALWRQRNSRTTEYPISCRTGRERCAYTTSDDWAIFALHNQFVRPLRDREWLPGEPCIIRRGSFELPPGASRYSKSSCGLPATAFDSFVFPNPPRQFLMASGGNYNCGFSRLSSSCGRGGTTRQGGRLGTPQLTQEQLLDLERMLWFDPEPRLERPFRLYADSKGCLKGRIHDIGHIMRSGW